MSIELEPVTDARRALHHVALCPADLDASLRFYRDGLGLSEIMDETIGGDWRNLFGADCEELRSIFLGDPATPDAGIVELVVFPTGVDAGPAPTARPGAGFFLLSFMCDVAATLDRLETLGLAREVRRSETPYGTEIATLRDPDGVMVELIPAVEIRAG